MDPCWARTWRVFCVVAAVTSASSLFARDAREAPAPPSVPFRMRALAMGPLSDPQAVQIVIERWSTNDESLKLVDAVVEKGEDKVWESLHDLEPRAGFMEFWPIEDADDIEDLTPTLGDHIPYAVVTSRPGGGWHIVFTKVEFTTVPANSTRYLDFTVGEIDLGLDGTGKGKLSVAENVTYDHERNELAFVYRRPRTVWLSHVTVER